MIRRAAVLALLLSAGATGVAGAQQQGGSVTVRASADVDYLDPGQAYYSFGYAVTNATQRPLYSFFPGATTPAPDLAAGPPELSADLKTVTVHLRPGVRFSPPVAREVTSADVKYAIERAFSASVPNGYAYAYFADIAGLPRRQARTPKPISGIRAPDPLTLVIKLRRPTGALVASALALPITAPVPEEVAGKLDRRKVSTYDRAVVATGPYVATRVPGKSIRLVRNPSWDRATDVRPAYLDAIDIRIGRSGSLVDAVLSGSHLLTGDPVLTPAILRRVTPGHEAQIATAPSTGTRYVALNTTVAPLNDVHVRRAILAGLNRQKLLDTRGGAPGTTLATHFLAPGNPGFAEAGGAAGPGDAFLATPAGNPQLRDAELKRAGAAGRHRGRRTLLMVGANRPPGSATAREVAREMRAMGFKIRLKLVDQVALYTKWCGVPRRHVAICPNVGWFADVDDPEGQLAATFGGSSIFPSGNVNWPQLNDTGVDRAIARARLVAPGPARLAAWADVDREVTATAAAAPYAWETTSAAESADVLGQLNPQSQTWDYAFTALR